MRLLAFLEYAALVIGALGMVAGQFFALPKGFNLGVFVAGAGFGLAGIDALVARRMPFRPSDEAYESYAGTPAVIVGLMVLAVGAGMMGAAYLLDNDRWHTTLSYLTRHPAPLVAVASLYLVGIGVLMMLNPQGRSGWLWRIFLYFPRWLLGVAIVAAGIALIAIAVWEWLEPGAFSRVLRRLSALLAYSVPHRP